MLKFQFDRCISRCRISSYYQKMMSWTHGNVVLSLVRWSLFLDLQFRSEIDATRSPTQHFTNNGDVKLCGVYK